MNHKEIKEALEYILGIGLTPKTEARARKALGLSEADKTEWICPLCEKPHPCICPPGTYDQD